MQTENNNIIMFFIGSTIIILLLAGFIITLIYLYQKNQLLYHAKFNALKIDHEKNLMSAQLEIQEETFQHISKEIHDNISLSLTLVKLHLNTLNIDDYQRAKQQINSSVELLSQSLDDLNSISKSLNPSLIITHGLIKAVESEISRINEIGLFKIELIISGDPIFLNTKKELLIFRIVQEAFNNIIKHAKASFARLYLDYKNDLLHVSIKDNGLGFFMGEGVSVELSSRAGLVNMASRAKIMGGTMEIESFVGQGTSLFFKIPF